MLRHNGVQNAEQYEVGDPQRMESLAESLAEALGASGPVQCWRQIQASVSTHCRAPETSKTVEGVAADD